MSTTSTHTDRTTDGTDVIPALSSINGALDALRPYALVAIRIALGFLLVRHGLDKFDTGLSNVAGAFDGWGVPLPEVSARFVAIFEVIGGAALILGVATRLMAAIMILVLLGAIYFVKLDVGVLGGWETDLAYISGLLALVFFGPGVPSLDRVLRLDR